jgi:murein L,D-transpeptidase YcbB/YkuD
VLALLLCVGAAGATESTLLAGTAAEVRVAGIPLLATPVLRDLYATDAPRWTAAGLVALRAEIDRAAEDGLEPRDFLVDALAGAERLGEAERQLLASEALARLAFTLRYGKANPAALDRNWNYSREFGAVNPVRWLRAAIAGDDLRARLAALRPQGPYYRGLVAELARLRALAAHGGWSALPTGDTLKPGADDPRVSALRTRLAADGELDAATAATGTLYTPALARAVESFQASHGLNPDGVVGRQTLAAINLPIAARIDQLRVNLERIRWVFRDLPGEFVVVNIAGFVAGYFSDGDLRWSARAIVGRPYRQTPVFKDELSYLELNPTWTVPPTILRNDILPRLRQDPGYLREKKLRVVDPNGGAVGAAAIDWRTVSAANFPYYLRQDPGPDNALGRIKFMFPNPHAVYLHDTPARELFRHAERSFSSGCIRIENPLALAALLLREPGRWNEASLRAAIDEGRTQRVNLPRRVPIMLLYLTAWPDRAGRVQYRRDLYGRDPAALAALDGPLVFSPPSDFAPTPPR